MKMQLSSLLKKQRLREINLSKVIWLVLGFIKPRPMKNISPISPYISSELVIPLFKHCTFQSDSIYKNVQWTWSEVEAWSVICSRVLKYCTSHILLWPWILSRMRQKPEGLEVSSLMSLHMFLGKVWQHKRNKDPDILCHIKRG